MCKQKCPPVHGLSGTICLVYSKNYLLTNKNQSKLRLLDAPPPNVCTCNLGPSINGQVTDRNTKLCCRGFVLAQFQCTTAYKIVSEHTQNYTKLFPVCKVEILQVTVNKLKFCHLFRLISADFRLKVPKIAKNGTLVSC